MTLVEVTLATAILLVLVAISMSAFIDVVRAVNSQDALVKMDYQANKALREIASLTRSAIFPVYVELPTGARTDESRIYFDIDHRDHGFGGNAGQRWLRSLQDGMDGIVFAMPIDAQGVGDFLDDANHLQIGQVRGSRSYLSASTTGTPGSGSGFVIRSGNEPVNVMAVMNPNGFTNSVFENKMEVTPADWENAFFIGGPIGWPQEASFIAVRFAPVTDASDNPIVINETNFYDNRINVDLDGDGNHDGQFQIGQLQLIYSGGNLSYVDGNTVRTETVPQLIVPLTPRTVLRRTNPSQRTPIFRLVNYDYSNLYPTGDFAGLIDPDGRDGRLALNMRILLLDDETLANKLVNKTNTRVTPQARWYENTVLLHNMKR